MNGFTNSILSLLLSWIRLLIGIKCPFHARWMLVGKTRIHWYLRYL